MDAFKGRQQTTQGVWVSTASTIDRPVVVIDCEGSDGRERGEEDTAFEKKTALLSLAMADVVLINIWCHDIGREHGAGKPLLRTVIQVNLKLFRPERRTTLAFVIRDKTKTPLDMLQKVLKEDIQAIWETIEKPSGYRDSAFEDLFDTHFFGMPSFELSEAAFDESCGALRKLFAPDCLLPPDGSRVPGAALALDMQNMWETITKNRDINIPAHRILVAQMRCGQVAREQAEAFVSSEEWQALRRQCDESEETVSDIGSQLEVLFAARSGAYDDETQLFDAEVRAHYRKQLAEDIFSEAIGVFHSQLDRWMVARVRAIEGRAAAFGTGEFAQRMRQEKAAAQEELRLALSGYVPASAPWQAEQYHESGCRKLDKSARRITEACLLREIGRAFEPREGPLEEGLRGLLAATAAAGDFWERAEGLAARAAAETQAELRGAVRGFELSEADLGQVDRAVEARAQAALSAFLASCTANLGATLRDVFMESFAKDETGALRSWRPGEDIPGLARKARAAACATLAALSVDARGMPAERRRAVERSVFDLALGQAGLRGAALPKRLAGAEPCADLAAAQGWGDGSCPPERVLATPAAVRSAWRHFVQDTQMAVQGAAATQEAREMASRRAPPLWALAAMAVLGWNELVALLRNPFALVLVAAAVYVAYGLYRELDLDQSVQERGVVGGLLGASLRLQPAARKVYRDARERVLGLADDAARRAGDRKSVV